MGWRGSQVQILHARPKVKQENRPSSRFFCVYSSVKRWGGSVKSGVTRAAAGTPAGSNPACPTKSKTKKPAIKPVFLCV